MAIAAGLVQSSCFTPEVVELIFVSSAKVAVAPRGHARLKKPDVIGHCAVRICIPSRNGGFQASVAAPSYVPNWLLRAKPGHRRSRAPCLKGSLEQKVGGGSLVSP